MEQCNLIDSTNAHLLAHARKSKHIVIKSSHQKAFSVVRMNCAKHYCPDGLPRVNVYGRSSVLMKYSASHQARRRSCVLRLSSPLALSPIRNPSTKSIACRTANDARLKARRIIAVADFNGRGWQPRWWEIEKLVELREK